MQTIDQDGGKQEPCAAIVVAVVAVGVLLVTLSRNLKRREERVTQNIGVFTFPNLVSQQEIKVKMDE